MKKQEIKPEQGKRLKLCLQYANQTQIQLAEKTFISQQTISKIINGKAPLSLDNAVRFSRALDVRLEYLLLEDDDMTILEKSGKWYTSWFDQRTACLSLISSLGFTVIDMQENADGTKESMHRRFKHVTINEDEHPDRILEIVGNEPPVRIFKIKTPKGGIAIFEQQEFENLLKDIQDYARFQCERPLRRFENALRIPLNQRLKEDE